MVDHKRVLDFVCSPEFWKGVLIGFFCLIAVGVCCEAHRRKTWVPSDTPCQD